MNLETVKNFNNANCNKMIGGYKENPVTIQEKLRWLNINDIPWCDELNLPLKTVCADKILVKEYVKTILHEDICLPTLTVYNNISDINWNDLPNQFVIKINHSSGANIICRDKSKLNIKDCINKMQKWLQEDMTFRCGFESHYYWIDRKILIEPLMSDENQKESLFDYKFWCFNGEPKLYTINDGNGHGDIMYYNMDDTENNLYGIQSKLSYKKPNNFDKMAEYSKILSKDFKFVRVDFYEINNKVYLGELTFTPGACMFHYKNSEDDKKIGDLLKI